VGRSLALASGVGHPEGPVLRILLQHRSVYRYPAPAALGPHQVRLRPASHARARVEHYQLQTPEGAAVRWQQDPSGNHVASLSFPKGLRLTELALTVELAVDIQPVNPFDFFLDDRCEAVPFAYPEALIRDLQPFLDLSDPAFATGPLFAGLLAGLPAGGPTVSFLVEVNRQVHQALRYVIREEAGLWTPEETLAAGRGSCRDQSVLLIALFRARGLAARFASGYLIQLADEGMLPDEPKGVTRDVADLHAWCEVFLPGGGWIGLDPTSGLLCGEGHVPLASVAHPALGAPVEGTADQPAAAVDFSMKVGRLGHEVRPTAPFDEAAWAALLDGADRADAALAAAGLALTSGGEPTFNSREHAALPEWNGDALGPTKLPAGELLAAELRGRLLPGAAVLRRQGKWYPGEPLPRWALELVGAADGAVLWPDRTFPSASADGAGPAGPADAASALRLGEAIAARLGLPPGALQPAHEDPWRLIQEEAGLPVDVDPLKAGLADGEVRRRLARLLDGDPARPAGYVLPLRREETGWRTARWKLRRAALFLVPGDSPLGLRLPLATLGGPDELLPREEELPVPDPRRAHEKDRPKRPEAANPIRTALCVEPRDGRLHVFLPPLEAVEDFLALLTALDGARVDAGLDLLLEGYPPPSSPRLSKLAVTPDPGVLEVNLPPRATGRGHAALLETVFEAGLVAGLHSEKWMVDGRLAGSGGGHHVTVGGPSPAESPLVRRPDLLASLITMVQHHPSLSYLFTGLFLGPTSQAPRADEGRIGVHSDLEIALEAAFEAKEPAPWLGDLLFRHLLTDLTGNTHRAELSIDKLWDWRTAHGRQGVAELRAFEMPPHPRMAAAQALLVRSLVAAFAVAPCRAPLVRWGTSLHDRFLLPHWLWQDFEGVLAFLAERGLALPAEPYRAFLELRCPLVGRLERDGLTLEVRNALEPWNVLGEEPTAGGTSRYVDSSVERLEVKVAGLTPGRHAVAVNGLLAPLRPTGTAGEAVAGVRFRAWAPAHALHAHLGIHHPLTVELIDLWARRSVGACRYHVWHPEGRAYLAPPLTRFEAAARRAQRFTVEGATPWPAEPRVVPIFPDAPDTLDLLRQPGDRPMPVEEEAPEPEPEEDAAAAGKKEGAGGP